MDKFVGVWWPGGDDDARAGGDGGQGLSRRSNCHAAGANFPAHRRTSRSSSSTRARARPPKDKVGENLYNRGVYNSMLIAEGDPQRAEDHRQESGDRRGRAPRPRNDQHHRRALEGARAGRLRRTAQAHLRRTTTATARAFMQQWDGTKWVKVSDWIAPHEGQGAAAARSRRQGIRREEHRLAEAHRGLRQGLVSALGLYATRVALRPGLEGEPAPARCRPTEGCAPGDRCGRRLLTDRGRRTPMSAADVDASRPRPTPSCRSTTSR